MAANDLWDHEVQFFKGFMVGILERCEGLHMLFLDTLKLTWRCLFGSLHRLLVASHDNCSCFVTADKEAFLVSWLASLSNVYPYQWSIICLSKILMTTFLCSSCFLPFLIFITKGFRTSTSQLRSHSSRRLCKTDSLPQAGRTGKALQLLKFQD